MARKPHPADDFNAGIVANATAWSAFTQAGGRITRHFARREEACRAAQVMADGFRRPALVYAIDAHGRTAVADTVRPGANPQKESTMTTIKTYAKRFNAQRAARKLLGEAAQEGEAFRTFKAANGDWNFETLAAQSEPPLPETEVAPPAKARAPKSAKPNKPEKLTRPERKERAVGASIGKRAAIEEAARRGNLPAPPDFSAPTHARFRAKLAKLIEMADAGDAEGLKAIEINPVSTSPRALARYRDLVVIAIAARTTAEP